MADAQLREIGAMAVWTVTSSKPGCGVEMLRDGKTDTYWQSDGVNPHYITIQFPKRVQILELRIYIDIKQDESYTPNKITIKAGNGLHDLQEIRALDLENPNGWQVVDMRAKETGAALHAFCLEVGILSNHQNGRDTHVRLVNIYGPRRDPHQVLNLPLQTRTTDFLAFAAVR